MPVGKCLSSVIPETWTKSIPASFALSVKRNGLESSSLARAARLRGGLPGERRPATPEGLRRHLTAGQAHDHPDHRPTDRPW